MYRKYLPEETGDLTRFLAPKELEKAMARKKEYEWWVAHPEFHWCAERTSTHGPVSFWEHYRYYGYLSRNQVYSVRQAYRQATGYTVNRGKAA